MILTDTGPLVALLDTSDPYHTHCVAASRRLPPEHEKDMVAAISSRLPACADSCA